MAGIVVVTLRLAWLILCNCVPLHVSNSARAEALGHGDFDDMLSSRNYQTWLQPYWFLECINMLLTWHFLPHSAPPFFFFVFIVFFLHIYSSLREMHGRRTRHCHSCPLCSRCLAFLTSTEASWLDRSLHCWNTRNLWMESWLTPRESPQTGRKHNGCKKKKKEN